MTPSRSWISRNPPHFNIFFLHSIDKTSTKVDFSPISCKKSAILHSKWTIFKSCCCFFLISLRSIRNLAHDFKSPLLDIEITIGKRIIVFLEKASKNPYHIEFFMNKNINRIRLPNLIGPILGRKLLYNKNVLECIELYVVYWNSWFFILRVPLIELNRPTIKTIYYRRIILLEEFSNTRLKILS